MAEALMTVQCDPKCGFLVTSHDKKEVIAITKKHAKDSHKMDMTDADVEKMMKKS